MSWDILGTSCDQCRSTVQQIFTSTETRRLVRTDSPGCPPRLSHSSWTMTNVLVGQSPFIHTGQQPIFSFKCWIKDLCQFCQTTWHLNGVCNGPSGFFGFLGSDLWRTCINTAWHSCVLCGNKSGKQITCSHIADMNKVSRVFITWPFLGLSFCTTILTWNCKWAMLFI